MIGQPPVDLVTDVAAALTAVGDGATVVLGMSGGPDSAGLALLVVAARPDLRLVAGHVRHGLRDDEPDRQAAVAQAEALGATPVVRDVRVVPDGTGPEAAARDARHAALQSIAKDHRAVAMLLGHTLDDQAETVLLRLARGTTLRGAAGMAVWRAQDGGVPVGHPLLGLRRHDVHKAVAEAGLPAVDDPTNTNPAFARNVLRHEVLPQLERHAGDPAANLARFAERAAEDADHLDGLARTMVDEHARPFEGGWAIAADEVFGAPPAIARRVVAHLLDRVRPSVGPLSDEVDEVLALAVDRRVDRRGVDVHRTARDLRVRPSLRASPPSGRS